MKPSIDLEAWKPYLDAFTCMQKRLVAGDQAAAKLYRQTMTAFLEASPDYWRKMAERAVSRSKFKGRTKREPEWWLQGVQPSRESRRRRK